MSNKPEQTPIAPPVQVGKSGYQLFSEKWPDGNVRFFAQVGRPYQNKDTGRTGIIAKFYLDSASDFIRATKEAETKLETIRNSQAVTSGTIEEKAQHTLTLAEKTQAA